MYLLLVLVRELYTFSITVETHPPGNLHNHQKTHKTPLCLALVPSKALIRQDKLMAEDGRCEATWNREFTLPWLEAGSPNDHDGIVDSDQ